MSWDLGGDPGQPGSRARCLRAPASPPTPHHELARASPRRCPRARRPTHYCTFLLEDPLPLVVVLCVVTVPGKAETGPVSSRVLEESDPRTRTQGRCPRSPAGRLGLPSPQGGRAYRLLLLLLLRGEGDRDRDCLRDGDLDE